VRKAAAAEGGIGLRPAGALLTLNFAPQLGRAGNAAQKLVEHGADQRTVGECRIRTVVPPALELMADFLQFLQALQVALVPLPIRLQRLLQIVTIAPDVGQPLDKQIVFGRGGFERALAQLVQTVAAGFFDEQV
jgi:hypothetical protein